MPTTSQNTGILGDQIEDSDEARLKQEQEQTNPNIKKVGNQFFMKLSGLRPIRSSRDTRGIQEDRNTRGLRRSRGISMPKGTRYERWVEIIPNDVPETLENSPFMDMTDPKANTSLTGSASNVFFRNGQFVANPLEWIFNAVDSYIWDIDGDGKDSLLKNMFVDPFTESKSFGEGLTAAGLNTLMGLGTDMDILTNPIKGALADGWRGFGRGIGITGEGRYIYNFDFKTGSDFGDFMANMGAELLTSMPTIIISTAGKAVKGVSKITESALKTTVSEIAEEALDPIVRESSQQLIKELSKDTAINIIQAFGEEASQVALKGLGGSALKEYSQEAAIQALNNYSKDQILKVLQDLFEKELIEEIQNSLTKSKGLGLVRKNMVSNTLSTLGNKPKDVIRSELTEAFIAKNGKKALTKAKRSEILEEASKLFAEQSNKDITSNVTENFINDAKDRILNKMAKQVNSWDKGSRVLVDLANSSSEYRKLIEDVAENLAKNQQLNEMSKNIIDTIGTSKTFKMREIARKMGEPHRLWNKYVDDPMNSFVAKFYKIPFKVIGGTSGRIIGLPSVLSGKRSLPLWLKEGSGIAKMSKRGIGSVAGNTWDYLTQNSMYRQAKEWEKRVGGVNSIDKFRLLRTQLTTQAKFAELAGGALTEGANYKANKLAPELGTSTADRIMKQRFAEDSLIYDAMLKKARENAAKLKISTGKNAMVQEISKAEKAWSDYLQKRYQLSRVEYSSFMREVNEVTGGNLNDILDRNHILDLKLKAGSSKELMESLDKTIIGGKLVPLESAELTNTTGTKITKDEVTRQANLVEDTRVYNREERLFSDMHLDKLPEGGKVRIIVEEVPGLLDGSENVEAVQKVFDDFFELYSDVKNFREFVDEAETFFKYIKVNISGVDKDALAEAFRMAIYSLSDDFSIVTGSKNNLARNIVQRWIAKTEEIFNNKYMLETPLNLASSLKGLAPALEEQLSFYVETYLYGLTGSSKVIPLLKDFYGYNTINYYLEVLNTKDQIAKIREVAVRYGMTAEQLQTVQGMAEMLPTVSRLSAARVLEKYNTLKTALAKGGAGLEEVQEILEEILDETRVLELMVGPKANNVLSLHVVAIENDFITIQKGLSDPTSKHYVSDVFERDTALAKLLKDKQAAHDDFDAVIRTSKETLDTMNSRVSFLKDLQDLSNTNRSGAAIRSTEMDSLNKQIDSLTSTIKSQGSNSSLQLELDLLKKRKELFENYDKANYIKTNTDGTIEFIQAPEDIDPLKVHLSNLKRQLNNEPFGSDKAVKLEKEISELEKGINARVDPLTASVKRQHKNLVIVRENLSKKLIDSFSKNGIELTLDQAESLSNAITKTSLERLIAIEKTQALPAYRRSGSLSKDLLEYLFGKSKTPEELAQLRLEWDLETNRWALKALNDLGINIDEETLNKIVKEEAANLGQLVNTEIMNQVGEHIAYGNYSVTDFLEDYKQATEISRQRRVKFSLDDIVKSDDLDDKPMTNLDFLGTDDYYDDSNIPFVEEQGIIEIDEESIIFPSSKEKTIEEKTIEDMVKSNSIPEWKAYTKTNPTLNRISPGDAASNAKWKEFINKIKQGAKNSDIIESTEDLVKSSVDFGSNLLQPFTNAEDNNELLFLIFNAFNESDSEFIELLKYDPDLAMIMFMRKLRSENSSIDSKMIELFGDNLWPNEDYKNAIKNVFDLHSLGKGSNDSMEALTRSLTEKNLAMAEITSRDLAKDGALEINRGTNAIKETVDNKLPNTRLDETLLKEDYVPENYRLEYMEKTAEQSIRNIYGEETWLRFEREVLDNFNDGMSSEKQLQVLAFLDTAKSLSLDATAVQKSLKTTANHLAGYSKEIDEVWDSFLDMLRESYDLSGRESTKMMLDLLEGLNDKLPIVKFSYMNSLFFSKATDLDSVFFKETREAIRTSVKMLGMEEVTSSKYQLGRHLIDKNSLKQIDYIPGSISKRYTELSNEADMSSWMGARIEKAVVDSQQHGIDARIAGSKSIKSIVSLQEQQTWIKTQRETFFRDSVQPELDFINKMLEEEMKTVYPKFINVFNEHHENNPNGLKIFTDEDIQVFNDFFKGENVNSKVYMDKFEALKEKIRLYNNNLYDPDKTLQEISINTKNYSVNKWKRYRESLTTAQHRYREIQRNLGEGFEHTFDMPILSETFADLLAEFKANTGVSGDFERIIDNLTSLDVNKTNLSDADMELFNNFMATLTPDQEDSFQNLMIEASNYRGKIQESQSKVLRTDQLVDPVDESVRYSGGGDHPTLVAEQLINDTLYKLESDFQAIDSLGYYGYDPDIKEARAKLERILRNPVTEDPDARASEIIKAIDELIEATDSVPEKFKNFERALKASVEELELIENLVSSKSSLIRHLDKVVTNSLKDDILEQLISHNMNLKAMYYRLTQGIGAIDRDYLLVMGFADEASLMTYLRQGIITESKIDPVRNAMRANPNVTEHMQQQYDTFRYRYVKDFNNFREALNEDYLKVMQGNGHYFQMNGLRPKREGGLLIKGEPLNINEIHKPLREKNMVIAKKVKEFRVRSLNEIFNKSPQDLAEHLAFTNGINIFQLTYLQENNIGSKLFNKSGTLNKRFVNSLNSQGISVELIPSQNVLIFSLDKNRVRYNAILNETYLDGKLITRQWPKQGYEGLEQFGMMAENITGQRLGYSLGDAADNNLYNNIFNGVENGFVGLKNIDAYNTSEYILKDGRKVRTTNLSERFGNWSSDDLSKNYYMPQKSFNEMIYGDNDFYKSFGIYHSSNPILDAHNRLGDLTMYNKSRTNYTMDMLDGSGSIALPSEMKDMTMEQRWAYKNEHPELEINPVALFSDEQIFQFLEDNPNYLLVYDLPGKGAGQGIRVKSFTAFNLSDIDRAREMGAKLMPVSAYKQLSQVLNQRVYKPTIMRLWHQMHSWYKTLILATNAVGTVVNNLLDTTVKNMIEGTFDDGSVNPIVAHRIMKEYEDIVEYFASRPQGSVSGPRAIRELFERRDPGLYARLKYFRQLDGFEGKDAYEAFQAVDNFFAKGSGGGLITSFKTSNELNTLHKAKMEENYNSWLYQTSRSSRDRIFGMMSVAGFQNEEANRLSLFLTKLKKTNSIDLDTTGLATEQVRKVKSTLIKNTAIEDADSWVRKTHFDYAFKSGTEKAIDYIIPFGSFQILNMAYWWDVLERKPSVIRKLLQINKANWQANDYTPEELAVIGAFPKPIRIFGNPNGKDLFLNAEFSSFGDVFNIVTNPWEALKYRISLPGAQVAVSKASENYKGESYWDNKDPMDKLLTAFGWLPGASSVVKVKNFVNNLNKGDTLETIKHTPGFGAVSTQRRPYTPGKYTRQFNDIKFVRKNNPYKINTSRFNQMRHIRRFAGANAYSGAYARANADSSVSYANKIQARRHSAKLYGINIARFR